MTVGTPNIGAPIRDNAAEVAYYAAVSSDDLLDVFATFLDWDDTSGDDYLWEDIATGIGYGFSFIYGAANEIENYIGQSYPVFNEIGSSSSFMSSTLPGAGEASNVATRVGLAFEASDYYDGAAWQLLFQPEWESITYDVNEGGTLAYELGFTILSLSADNSDVELAHEYEADALWTFADDMLGWDMMWCSAIDGEWGYCNPHDLLVPTAYQGYSGATYNLSFSDVNHPDEPEQSATISSALNVRFVITAR